MPFWSASSRWVALRFCGCFLSPIELALPFWVGQKVVRAFLRLQALNPHTLPWLAFCYRMQQDVGLLRRQPVTGIPQ